ncbi:MAG: radical SAM/SPASM domain-containing protein, partial [Candidatus Bathyarchaeia archaeon]
EMTTRQILDVLRDARNAGFTDYIVWGGEPLLRSDLPKILSYSNRLGLDNTLITNGSRLAERIEEIGEDLYGLIISLDYPEPELHDDLRGHKGIFYKAIKGINKAKDFSHINIFINCVIHKGNLSYLRDMAELAKNLDVKITYEIMEIVKGYNEHLSLTAEEVTDIALELLELKSKGYPIANSSAYFKALAEHTKYQCQVPKVLVTVEWDGRIRVCSTIADDNKPDLMEYDLGNVTRNSFREIFASKNYLKYVEEAEKCHKCDLSYPREIALIYSFNGEAIRNFFNRIAEITAK